MCVYVNVLVFEIIFKFYINLYKYLNFLSVSSILKFNHKRKKQMFYIKKNPKCCCPMNAC